MASGASAHPHHTPRRVIPKATRERLDMRISSELKAVLQRAADVRAQSLTDYVLSRAGEAAARDIREHEVLTLSVRDSERFAQLLIDPPEPNEHLLAAARRHDELLAP